MADFADPRRLWTDGSALHLHGAAITRLTPGPVPTASAVDPEGVVEIAGSEFGTTLLRVDVALGDAVGFWHPGAGWDRHLAADWMTGWRTVGLVDSAPLGCLYDGSGRSLLGFATDRLAPSTRVRFGLGERTGRFGVWLAMDLRPGEICRVRVAAPGTEVAETVRSLTRWQSGAATLPVPDAGRVPAYSTWYAYHQEVGATAIEAEAKLAAEAGCGLLILDDGWQRGAHGGGYAGCGDWEPDPEKFPDFGAHVATVRGLGLTYLAWIAPLLLGDDSAARDGLAAFAPHVKPNWRCHVLDPRHEGVRRFVVDSCVRLVDRYGLDGLKIDFLDAAMVYAGEGGDVGEAMRALLVDLRDGLRSVRGTDLLIELRQPYTGAAMREFGNLLRAGDCPADAVGNRVRTVDLAVAGLESAVHSDMLMWDPKAPPQAAARQLLSVLHAVPQISVRLAELPADHRAMTAFWLAFWREHRDVLMHGALDAGRPDELHPVVIVSDASRAVLIFHAQRHAASLDPTGFAEVALVNNTDAERVLLDLTRPAVVRLDVSDVCGTPVRSETTRLEPGPQWLAVPPSGLCLIRPA
ncbi:glycoside hydrolase family 36 protein [Nonomuraea sp. NPDC005983]|uniref:glycoside hydrolase family 36 protein n=1 Tax=Nonomuraea sp. NPDC005983 TaxID=3155595 RepID=UPI0033A8399D